MSKDSNILFSNDVSLSGLLPLGQFYSLRNENSEFQRTNASIFTTSNVFRYYTPHLFIEFLKSSILGLLEWSFIFPYVLPNVFIYVTQIHRHHLHHCPFYQITQRGTQKTQNYPLEVRLPLQ